MPPEHMAQDAPDKSEIARLREFLDAARHVVVLTGAGISTESGIPDFRSPGGIWSRMAPITYQEFVASEAARLKDWRRRFVMNEAFAEATPNAGHRGLALMAAQGRIATIVTQNIDGLHQRAGTPAERLIEIHGNATHAHCLECRTSMTLAAARKMIEATGASPRCGCGGLVKAAVVSFGESLPADVLARATNATRSADVFLVVGSSLVVQPAASLPEAAKANSSRLVIINREATPLDPLADLTIRAPIGRVFVALCPQLVN
jgi:NAD-dependent deacetylase